MQGRYKTRRTDCKTVSGILRAGDQAGTVVSQHLIDIRDAIQVLYAAVVGLHASTVIGSGAGAVQVPGVIDQNVQRLIADRLWDLHNHANDGLDQAKTIINA